MGQFFTISRVLNDKRLHLQGLLWECFMTRHVSNPDNPDNPDNWSRHLGNEASLSLLSGICCYYELWYNILLIMIKVFQYLSQYQVVSSFFGHWLIDWLIDDFISNCRIHIIYTLFTAYDTLDISILSSCPNSTVIREATAMVRIH